MSSEKSERYSRRTFLQTAASAGALAAVGTAQAAPSINVYLYQNTPTNLDPDQNIDTIVYYANQGLQGTLDDLVNEGVIGGYNIVDRTSAAYPSLADSGNCNALDDFNKWLWNNGYTEGTQGSGENAAHILVRDSDNGGNRGGCAAGTTVWYKDTDETVGADYDGDGYTEYKEAVPRAIISQDWDGSDDGSSALTDGEEIETAAAHEFSHLVVEGAENSDSGCWSSNFSVSPDGNNEHAVGTWSDTKGQLSIMSRKVAASGADKQPCRNETNRDETGLWHSTCYVDLANCTRDYYT